MTDVLVVGAGLAGLACARRVAEAGLTVRVVDRGRRPGGRLGARTLGDHEVDLGAPYCTVADDRFRAVVDDWLDRGLLREWTDTFHVAGPGGIGAAKTGPMRYAAPGGMRSLADDLAAGLAVERRAVASVTEEDAGVVVLAMPGPQAARLLPPELAAAADQPYDPAIAVALRFAERTWADFDAAFVSDLAVRWLADDGASRGDRAPVLVAHTTPDVARENLDAPSDVVPQVVDAVGRILGTGEPVETLAHRWTFAQPAAGRDRPFLLQDRIGLCGDGWAERSKVESAWLSGDALGRAIAAR